MGRQSRRTRPTNAFLDAMRELFAYSGGAVDSLHTPNRGRDGGIATWLVGFDKMLDKEFDGQLFQSRECVVRFEKVYANGDVVANVVEANENYAAFVRLKSDQEPTVGCTCDVSLGTQTCKHLAQMVWQLRNALHYVHHPLHSRIVNKVFDEGSLDVKKFKVDQSQRNLDRLDVIARSLVASTLSVDSQELIVSHKPTTESRIGWNVKPGTFPEIVPVLQHKKKSGTGYNKPKEIEVADLLLFHSQSLRDVDRQILSLAKRESKYDDAEFPFIESLRCLVGDDQVWMEGQLIQIEFVALFLQIATSKHDGSLLIAPVNADGNFFKNPIEMGDDFAYSFNEQTKTLEILNYPPEQHRAIWSLVGMPGFDRKRETELIQKLNELQLKLPIVLPNSTCLSTKTAEPKPLLLLRSRATGELDFGLRGKLPSGTIAVLGAPPCVERAPDTTKSDTTSTDNSSNNTATGRNNQVQWIRNFKQEEALAKRWIKELKLPTNAGQNYSGTFHDFERALNLLERLESLKENIEVLWSKDSTKPSRVLGSISSKNLRVEITSKRNWFGITGDCQLGDASLPLEQVLENLGTTANPTIGNFVRVGDGQWARIEEGLRKKLLQVRDATHSERKNLLMDSTAAQAIQALSDVDVEVKAAKAWGECMKRLVRAESLEPTLPAGLKADLREYQVDGYRWLRRLAEWGVGGILADDMGLGKTLQTLAVLLDRASEGPALVIAPTSVGFNWIRECQRFAPELRPILYRESDRKELLSNLQGGDLVVSSYALALRDGSELAKIKWGTLVMDEAQAIKNARSKTSQAVATFDAKWTIALTGTPMENHLGELWSLFSVVSPGVFGGWESFRKRYATPIEKQNDDEAKGALARRLQPFILRRTKEEVLTELPPRTEMVVYVDLSPEERAQYELIRRSAIGEVQNIAALPDIQDQRFKILALLTRLRQFACHPGIVNKQWDKSSAKLDQLCETLTSLQEEGHRALVFSQFTEHLALIRAALDKQGISYQYLDGSTPAAERQKRVDEFQSGSLTAFLISLKAGGTGLNLTAADYVIHMDPWWNPAVEDQATDRAHRFGQDKPVMVYRIVAKGTIEEEILALHETKRDLVDGILEGTNAAAKFSTKDLIEMIAKT
jgi:SNF2 family DNA or RNA helicase